MLKTINIDSDEYIWSIVERIYKDGNQKFKEMWMPRGAHRDLFRLVPLPQAVCDMDGLFVEVNVAYENLVGCTLQELLGLRFSDITPPQYKESDEENMKAVRTTGRFGPLTKEYFRKRSGDWIKVTLWGRTCNWRYGLYLGCRHTAGP